MQCTRPWFGWANALLVTLVEQLLGLDCEAAAEAQRLEAVKVWPVSRLGGGERLLALSAAAGAAAQLGLQRGALPP